MVTEGAFGALGALGGIWGHLSAPNVPNSGRDAVMQPHAGGSMPNI